MYEIVVTYRADFTERVVDRFNSAEEAHLAARRLAEENYDKIVRVWIKVVRQVGSQG